MSTVHLDGLGGQARRAASRDASDKAADSAPMAVSTTRAAGPSVYVELERVQRKCAAHRREIARLRKAGSAEDNAVLRIEADRYRQALSYIAYRLQNGGMAEDELKSCVASALLLRGSKGRDRRRVERFYEREESQALAKALNVPLRPTREERRARH